MVFVNYSTMQMVAKIVFYGPGLCGKTTNLKEIYRKTSNKCRGEMVSLETETDRTLFFDLLPLDVGTIGGFKTKFQLYTVPGQVFYNATRKLVLKGVDGIVFVADSQVPMLEASIDSFENMKENLDELGLTLDDIPLVLQYNKRDLRNIVSVEELNAALNHGNWPYIEASALKGVGVFETLKEISKETLIKLRNKNTDERKPPPPKPKPVPKAKPEPPPPKQEEEPSDHEIGEFTDGMPKAVSFEDYKDKDKDKAAPEPPKVRSEETDDNLDLDISIDDVDIGDDELEFEEGEVDIKTGEFPDPDPKEPEASAPKAASATPESKPQQDKPAEEPPKTAAPSPDKDISTEMLEDEPLEEAAPKPKVPAPKAKKPKVSNPLGELSAIGTQAKKRSQNVKSASVDNLLSGIVGGVGSTSAPGKKVKSQKFQIEVPKAFSKAQLNCVFLDDKENVLHAHLLKVEPHKVANGKYQIKVILDVDVP